MDGTGIRRAGRVAALAAGGVLLLGGVVAGGGAAPMMAQRPATGQAAAQGSPVDQAALQTLAERLLAAPYPTGPSQGPLPAVRLLPGQVPSDFPLALPTPPDARLVGSMVRNQPASTTGPGGLPSGPATPGTTVVWEAPGTRADLLTLYEQALIQQGWTAAPGGSPFAAGGFQTTFFGGSLSYCRGEDGPWLAVAVYPLANQTNDVHLTLTENAGPCSVPSPISARTGFPRGAELLPRLAPPPGVQLQPAGGGGGGPNRWSSDATAETTRAPGELEAYFAPQMQAAGWVRQAGATDGQLAWSTWALPSEGDWQGMLLVATWPTAGQRWLSVRVESPSLTAQFGGAGGSYNYIGPMSEPGITVGPPPAPAPPPTALPRP